MKVSERRIFRVLGQHRSTQRYQPRGRKDEGRLVADMVELARQYGSYGYRRVVVLLRDAGWQVSDGRVERLWKREGLKVPAKQPKKGRLWLNDGSCVRLRPEYRNHIWSYDFVHCRTDDGKACRTLNNPGRVQSRVSGDPGETEAELDRRDRRLDRPVHPARTTGLRPERQWS